MLKYLILPFLFATTVANAAAEISYVNCMYFFDGSNWSYSGVSWMTLPFQLAPKETRVIEAASYYPIQDLDSPGVTRCSELVGTSMERFILKTHHYRFQHFEKFNENSCVPIGDGVEFVEMTADLIGIGKPYFAEMVYPWKPELKGRTVFNVITGDQIRAINEASDENRNKMFTQLCEAQKPRY